MLPTKSEVGACAWATASTTSCEDAVPAPNSSIFPDAVCHEMAMKHTVSAYDFPRTSGVLAFEEVDNGESSSLPQPAANAAARRTSDTKAECAPEHGAGVYSITRRRSCRWSVDVGALLVPGDRVRHVRLLEPRDLRRRSASSSAAASASSTWATFVAPTIGAVTPAVRAAMRVRPARSQRPARRRPRPRGRRRRSRPRGRRASRRRRRSPHGSSGRSPSRVRFPARRPRASGLHGSTPTPWSTQSGIISRSSSR